MLNFGYKIVALTVINTVSSTFDFFLNLKRRSDKKIRRDFSSVEINQSNYQVSKVKKDDYYKSNSKLNNMENSKLVKKESVETGNVKK